MTVADKIVILRAGRIEQVGAPLELYRDPDNRFVAGFIGSPSMNLPATKAEEGAVVVPGLGGARLALPANGTEAILGIRPQHIELDRDGATHGVDMSEGLGGSPTSTSKGRRASG